MNAGRLAILASLVLAGCAGRHQAMNATPDNLEGKWSCVSATINGKPLPAETVGKLELELTGGRYQTRKGEQVLFDSTYTTSVKTTPKQISMVGTEGDLAGKEAQGIYLLNGDSLTICYTMPGKERPTLFESKEGSDAYLTVWQRRKM